MSRRRPAWILVGLCLVVGLALAPWGGPRSVRAFVGDKLGVRRVEGFATEIGAAARESGVDPCLLAAVCFMESRGQVDAVSSADALGLMQVKDAAAGDAARRLGLAAPTREAALSDAALNLRLGADHLRWLFGLDPEWGLEPHLVAYNAGRARLLGWIAEVGSWKAWRAREHGRMVRGEANTGCLAYARRVLDMRELFAERGRIVAP